MLSQVSLYWLFSQNWPHIDPAEFLSTAEQEFCEGLRFPARRTDWLHGRFTAKQLFCLQNDGYGLSQVEIDKELGGAPFYRVDGLPLPASLSISHRCESVFCAVCFSPGVSIGADVEYVEPRSEAFVQDYLTAAEVRQVQGCPPHQRPLLVNLIWSAKESALKALRLGLRMDTRAVEVSGISLDGMKSPEWQPLNIHTLHLLGQHWQAWWQSKGDFVLTLATLSSRPMNLFLIPANSVPKTG